MENQIITYEEYEPKDILNEDIYKDDEEDLDELSYENSKDYINMMKFVKNSEEKDTYMKIYSKFDNFPSNIKKQVFINIIIMIMVAIAFFVCVFGIKYISAILLITCGILEFYLGIKVWSTFFYFKNARFKSFTGKIIESYPVGSKITNNKHYVIKLKSENGKELCFKYFGSANLLYDQSITLFIHENSTITSSNYGPLVETYIEAVPTDDIKSKLEFMKLQEEDGTDTISVDTFLDV